MTMNVGATSGLSAILLQQLQQARAAQFGKVDTNGDGKLTQDEILASLQSVTTDTDEQKSMADGLISVMDTDGDGTISQQESADSVKKFVDAMSGLLGSLNGLFAAPAGEQSQADRFAALDTNGDGTLDQGEFTAMIDDLNKKTGQSFDAVEMFSKADTDGDGVVSQDEFKAAAPDKKPAEASADNLAAAAQQALLQSLIALLSQELSSQTASGTATGTANGSTTINNYYAPVNILA